MTLGELTHEIAKHHVRAFVVQYYDGRWHCGVRMPDGRPASLTVAGESPLDVIEEVLSRLKRRIA